MEVTPEYAHNASSPSEIQKVWIMYSHINNPLPPPVPPQCTALLSPCINMFLNTALLFRPKPPNRAHTPAVFRFSSCRGFNMKAGTFSGNLPRSQLSTRRRQVLMSHRWRKDCGWSLISQRQFIGIIMHLGTREEARKRIFFDFFFPHLKSIKDCRWMVLASHDKDCFLFWFRHHVKAIFMYIVSFSSVWERVFQHYFPALKQCSLNSNHQSSPGLIELSPPHSLRLTLCLLRKLSGC